MRSASVRELKNNTSQLLRRASQEDVVITSRGRPIACLIGLRPDDISIRERIHRLGYGDDKYRQRAFRLLARIWKIKPDKGKKWVSHDEHDAVIYGEPSE